MKNNALKIILKFILFVVIFVGFWILMDFVVSTFITHSGFAFTVKDDIIKPLIPAVSCGVILQVLGFRKKA